MHFKQFVLKDKVILSAASGMLGTLVMYCIGIPLYMLKVAKIIYLSYSAELFITQKLAQTFQGLFLAFLPGSLSELS